MLLKTLLILLSLLIPFLQAQSLENTKPPSEKTVDWMELNSGEWINGEFKGIYSGSVEFDSDKFDLVNFDLVDVKQIITNGFVTLNLNADDIKLDSIYKSFQNHEDKKQTTIAGILHFRNHQFQITLPDGTISILKEDEIASIAGGEPKESNYWSGNIFLGFDISTGNSEQVTLSSKANVIRRTASSRFMADYIGTYTAVTDGVVTANNNRINSGLDTYQTAHFYFRVIQVEYLNDTFQNIQGRYTASAGIGYDIIHTPQTDLSITTGPGYQHTDFSSVAVGEKSYVSTPLAFLDLHFDTELTSRIDYIFKYNANFMNKDSSLYTHHLETSLETELIADLDLDISLFWDRTENPVAFDDGTFPKQDDFKTLASIGYSY